MVVDEGLAELVFGHRHGDQAGNALGQEVLLQNALHRRPFLGVLVEHLLHQVLQVIGVRVRDGRLHAAQNLEHQPLHAVRVEGVFQRDHLLQDAAQRPHVALLVVGLLLADFGR